MRRYVRPAQAGGTWFVTVVLAQRQGARSLIDVIEVLGSAIRDVKQRHPFNLLALSVMPDHWHAVMALPDEDTGISRRIMLIKSWVSRQVPANDPVSPSRQRRRERGFWQRRFHEHLIRDATDLARHVDYVHFNPVKHGLVAKASDWPWSTIHREIRRGAMSPDWAADPGSFSTAGE